MGNKFKVVTWNIARIQRNLELWLDLMKETDADFFCIQEPKTNIEKARTLKLDGYKGYAVEAKKKANQSGCAVYYKQEPIKLYTAPGELANDGRMIIAEYSDFYIINAYLPNSGENKDNLDSKIKWFEHLIKAAVKLDKIKPVIICGDLNVSIYFVNHRGKIRKKSSAGFTNEEQALLKRLLEQDFIDVVSYNYLTDESITKYLDERSEEPELARKGYRNDYILVSNRLTSSVDSVHILTEYQRSKSDKHFPVELVLKI